jgi:transposase
VQSLQAQAAAIASLYQAPTVGRPSDIGDAEVLKQLLEAIADGNYMETACHLVGLSKVTVHNWTKRGEAGEAPFDRFVNAVKAAEARAEAKMVANVRRASELPQFWAAAATHLERRHPDRWGKRQDDTQAPRVVVQIGVGVGEVKVGMLVGPSPTLSEDLHRLSPSVDNELSPINRDYVNHAEATRETVPAQADRQIPAGESQGDPTPVAQRHGGQRKPARLKGRSTSPKRKKARVAQTAPVAG